MAQYVQYVQYSADGDFEDEVSTKDNDNNFSPQTDDSKDNTPEENENNKNLEYVASKDENNNNNNGDDDNKTEEQTKKIQVQMKTFEEANDITPIAQSLSIQGWTKDNLPKCNQIYTIKVEGNVLVEKPKKNYMYIIGVRTLRGTYWQVRKTYGEIRKLHQNLGKHTKNLPNFTRKIVFNVNENVVLQRQEKIIQYFKDLQPLSDQSLKVRIEIEKFLDIHDVNRFIINDDWDFVEYLQAEGVHITNEQYQTIRVLILKATPNRKKGHLVTGGA